MMCWLVMVFLPLVATYNLDLDLPSIFRLPEVPTLHSPKGNTYFGYSVGLHPRASAHYNTSWFLQIGAPKLEVAGTKSGGVFRCHTDGGCQLQAAMSPRNVYQKMNPRLYEEMAEDAWVGVSMDMRKTDQGYQSVVCGHRFGYQTQGTPQGVSQDHYLRPGVCFVDDDGNTTRLTPLKNEERAYFGHSKNAAGYDWGLGLAGTSVSIANASGRLAIGAPNVYLFTGNVVSYVKQRPFVPKIRLVKALKGDMFAYFGYSVAYGQFFGDGTEWTVMGAPRARDLLGRVVPFKLQGSGDDVRINLHPSILTGKTMGEYFGGALAVSDVNGDSFDDLLVGAPTFSLTSSDQGRVYVFLGGKKVLEESQTFEGHGAGGRFGTCLSAVGDLDNDGFFDVAVGAPYEGGAGALYLYRGSPRGLRLSQKVHGSDVSPSLRGFGISISHGVDVDGDQYPEISVGSYLSEEVVVLRSRPVVTLVLNITHPPFIDRRQPNFNATFCISYVGQHPPPKIGVSATCVVDENYSRATFELSRSSLLPVTNNVSISAPFCSTFKIKLDRRRVEGSFDHPVALGLEAHLVHVVPTSPWQPLSPVLAVDAPRARTDVNVPFSGECGADNVCTSRLHLHCTQRFRGENSLRLGSRDSMRMSFRVGNGGELAKNTRLLVAVHGGISPLLRSRDAACSSSDGTTLVCKLDSLSESSQRTLELDISASDSVNEATSRSLSVSAAVMTDSNDVATDNKTCQVQVDLSSDTALTLLASPPSNIHLHGPTTVLNFTHTYNVDKSGISPLTGVMLNISVPIAVAGVTFAAISEPVWDNLDSTDDETDYSNSIEVSSLSEPLFDSSKNVSELLSLGNGSTLVINCSCPAVTCVTVTVTSSFTHHLTLIVNLTTLEPFLKDKKMVHLESNGSVAGWDGFGSTLVARTSATTCIVLASPAPSAGINVIVMSIAAGALIYAMIFSALLRQGFFRRKTKEQIEALKTEDFIKERFSMYDSEQVTRKMSDVSYNTIAPPDYDNTKGDKSE